MPDVEAAIRSLIENSAEPVEFNEVVRRGHGTISGRPRRETALRPFLIGLALVGVVTVVAGRAIVRADHASSPASARPEPQLPAHVSDWLQKRFDASALGKATSADWVLTTHVKAEAVASGAILGDDTAVYLFDVHGNFVWNHSCLAGAPPSSCVSIGTHQIFTLDAQRLEILSFSIQRRAPRLAELGPVGHEQIRNSRR